MTPEVLENQEEAPSPYFEPREEAVRRYALIFGDSLSFTQGETVAFADVFPYFTCAGVYRPDEAYLYSLPELTACRDGEEWVYTIPAETAEDLIAREILTEEDFPEDMREGDVYEPSEDLGALAELLEGHTGTAAADEALILAVYDYQRQTPRRSSEWSLLPAFSEDCPPDWVELVLYVYMMCEDTGENAEGYSTMTDEAFDATVERYLPGISYTPADSPYFAYADGVHTSRGWGDVSGDLLLPVSLTCHGDGTYTLVLNGYCFYEMEDFGDEAHPFQYLSCERPPLPPQA